MKDIQKKRFERNSNFSSSFLSPSSRRTFWKWLSINKTKDLRSHFIYFFDFNINFDASRLTRNHFPITSNNLQRMQFSIVVDLMFSNWTEDFFLWCCVCGKLKKKIQLNWTYVNYFKSSIVIIMFFETIQIHHRQKFWNFRCYFFHRRRCRLENWWLIEVFWFSSLWISWEFHRIFSLQIRLFVEKFA